MFLLLFFPFALLISGRNCVAYRLAKVFDLLKDWNDTAACRADKSIHKDPHNPGCMRSTMLIWWEKPNWEFFIFSSTMLTLNFYLSIYFLLFTLSTIWSVSRSKSGMVLKPSREKNKLCKWVCIVIICSLHYFAIEHWMCISLQIVAEANCKRASRYSTEHKQTATTERQATSDRD